LTDISIKETIEDKNSWFNVKRFRIGGIKFEKPVKSLDVRELTQNTYDTIAKKHNFTILEATKVIRNFDVIQSIMNENNDAKINEFFYKKRWLSDSNLAINITFNFNPYRHVSKIDKLSGFFDHYYQFSKLLVSVPNIRTTKQPPKGKQQIIIDLKNYQKFVDESYHILNTKNNKPIFVPISLRLSIQDLAKLINYYLKKEYFYYWIDFEGKAINELSLSRLRHIFRIIKNSKNFKKTICYSTNIKREIISNAKKELSPASDVLASIAGANIIGLDREPPRMIEGPSVPIEHKARTFEPKSYYYVKTKLNQFPTKDKNVTYNSVQLDNEFTNQTNYFLKNATIVTVLDKKKMLKTYRDGAILKELTTKDPDTALDTWF